MNIRLTFVKAIDGPALYPLAALIHSYLQANSNVKMIEVGPTDIRFSKGFFSSTAHIKYLPYQLVCKNGVIYYYGEARPGIPNDNLFTLLVNILHQLRPGYICKI